MSCVSIVTDCMASELRFQFGSNPSVNVLNPIDSSFISHGVAEQKVSSQARYKHDKSNLKPLETIVEGPDTGRC